jgi:hypothetical protein
MSKISFGSKLHFIFIFNLVKERGERREERGNHYILIVERESHR